MRPYKGRLVFFRPSLRSGVLVTPEEGLPAGRFEPASGYFEEVASIRARWRIIFHVGETDREEIFHFGPFHRNGILPVVIWTSCVQEERALWFQADETTEPGDEVIPLAGAESRLIHEGTPFSKALAIDANV